MARHTIGKFFTWFVIAFAIAMPVGSQAGELPLAKPLMKEINTVLSISSNLHLALVTQNEEQIEISVREMILQIDRARQASSSVKAHDRAHLMRMLDAAREQLEFSQTAYGQERRDRLEEAFNQLVNIVRTYKVDRAYAIYFCPKDRTTWVQKGNKTQNPFRNEPQREPCGIRVPK